MKIGARLNKAEQEQKIREIIAFQNRERHSPQEIKQNEYNWQDLARDHYTRLRLDLEHIGRLQILDALQGDTLDGGSISMREYIQHYDDYEISRLIYEIRSAQQSLVWLDSIIDQEQAARAQKPADKGNIISFYRPAAGSRGKGE